MRVIPVASTVFYPAEAEQAGYRPHWYKTEEMPPEPIDELAEFAGRNCYQSWNRPNPETSTNQGYLKNIIEQGHFSVLEHASVTFFVDGVSRSLLTELERHRFLSFSVISQRYVRMDDDNTPTPRAIHEHGNVVITPGSPTGEDWRIIDEFESAIEDAFDSYNVIADKLLEAGLTRKKALEAARAVLPNAAEVKMVVTGNIRAWRDVLSKRYHEAADAEIREFAAEVLKHLRELAPHSVQDIPEVPYA